MMQIKIRNTSHHPLPKYETAQSAGMDLRAYLPDGPVTLRPMERGLVTVLNSPGTIDADYRGEICVILINLSQEDFVINDGERIAQMVIARHEQAEIVQVEELSDTERGAGGFGHTGKN